MPSSKIFSGDLPELMNDIIKYLQNDFSTLHSCILVNRLWCRLAIPLLWENPFSIPTENYNFIEFYLNNLNNDLRSKLNEYKINDNSLPSSTLFNYPSFIKYLNTESIIFSIRNWFDTLKPGRRYFLLESDIHSVLEFEKLISMLLFKLFIENEVNLHIFEIEVIENSTNSYLEDVLELMLQNPNFTHNIRNLKLHINVSRASIITNTSIKNRISQMVNSHQILKKIVLCYGSLYLYQSLLLSNNCSNSLNTITFYYINFYGILNLDKVFDQLNVLESVHIVYCYNHFIQQIVNSLTSKPFKLKSLFIIEMTPIESLQLLLQKSSNYLENFGYESGFRYKLPYKQQLSELVIKYCKNIKFLDLYEFDYQIICLTLNLIENVRQSLNYLSINICKALFSIGGIERSSIILRNLGQNFPFRLEYLCLTLNIKMNDFEIFLKNSQNTFIKKLLINNIGDGDDILSCVKENIMKKKRVKYLAIMETTFDKYGRIIFEDKELFSLKNEVEEFELYDIIIQKYIDLVIKTNVIFAKKLE